MEIPAELLGTPGAPMMLDFLPPFEDSQTADESAFDDFTNRAFVISGQLSKEPTIIGHTGHIKGDFDQNDGGCYLMAPVGADMIRIDTLSGHFHIKKNSVGELSLIEFEFSATCAHEARAKFVDTVYPFLDHVSYVYNISIFVVMLRIYDKLHRSTHIVSVAPYRNQAIGNSENYLTTEMKPIYSMYRESKNANSNFYKFLCCYKIMEGLLGSMRSRAYSTAKAKGVALKNGRETVPSNADIPSDLEQYVGTSIKAFFDEVLTAKFRHAVAHFSTDNGVLHVSSSADLDTYANLAFVTDLCARTLIESHERLLKQL